MTQSDYWEERFTLLNERLINKGDDFVKHARNSYAAVMNEIEKDINNFYMRFANENNITFQQAKQILTSSERQAFQMELDEYIKYARQKNLSPQWVKKLENASTVHRVTKLQAIQFQFQQQVEKLEASKLQGLTDTLKDVYKENYYRTAYEIQKGTGIGQAFSKIDENKIEKVLARPWAADGKNFSDRIWKDKAQLIHQLNTRFTQGVIRGDAPKEIIKDMAKALNVSEHAVKRLVLTEIAFITASTRKDVFEKLNVEKYKIRAALSKNTCAFCGALDGKVFDMKDFKIGVTAHPFHPSCRCTEVPYYDDSFSEGKQRAAKDENGKTYYVPADTTFTEWRNKYVDNPKSESIDKNDNLHYNKNKVRSIEELQKKAEEMKEIVEEYSVNPSKWSGNIIIDDELSNNNALGEKRQSCDIAVVRIAGDDTILHEMFHSCSASYYSSSVYINNQSIEEASVEFLTQQVCKERNIIFECSYQKLTGILQLLNGILFYSTDLEFAKELFNIPLPDRYEWLRNEVEKVLKKEDVSLQDYEDIINFVRRLEGGE